MKNQLYINALSMIISLIITGCTSLQSKDIADRDFSEFLSQSQHYALFTPVSIKSEGKLNLLGISDYGQHIGQQYGIKNPILNVINQFTKSIPSLSRTIIVQPEKANDLSLPLDFPVLFFHSDWNLIYRRVPPSFSMNQLQVGIVGKIIPFGQVLSNRGPTALRTASWEGKCFYKVFGGEYLSLEEWEANNGKLLNRGIEEAQNYCAKKFINEFSNDLISR
ncbi:MAG: hypothetical protein JRD88_09200 [Deltaproteobacteria bacterium]|jgi:hypothetical protein|nr:hypothetical protein [Deltaproteobacteria bacterium]